jgi:hypothetical protein
MDRISRSWKLVKLSWHLVMQDKEILVFPIISAAAAILLFVGLVMPTLLVSANTPYALLALWYFITAFVTVFMNAALFACVKKRLHGGDPTISYGLKEASKRIVPIILWSLLTATVGLILRVLEEWADDNLIAQILISIIGTAWSLMTMFVVPVLVVERVGVIDAIRRSANLFRKTWGENAVAAIGMGLGFLLFYIIGILVFLVALFTMSGIAFWITIGVVIVYIATVAVFQSTMEMVFNAVLYSYATGDNVPLAFKQMIGEAFEEKKKKR